MKKIFGLFYGALIAGSYLVIKKVSGDLFIVYFSVSCLGLAFCLIPFLRLPFPKPFSPVLLRGIMYAITNFMFLTSQSNGSVSSSLAAALIGSMCISVPSLVKHPFRIKNFIIIISLFLGGFLLYDQIKVSYLALISGLLQAVTFSSASRSMRAQKNSIIWNLFVGFVIVAIFGSIGFMILPVFSRISEITFQSIIPICIVTLVAQIAFFTLYKEFKVESASRYSLGRIPWSFLIEMIYTGNVLPFHTIMGAIFLSFGSFTKRERRSEKRFRQPSLL